MSRFQPSQPTLIALAAVLAVIGLSILRSVELRRKDGTIERLESQLRAADNQAARWKEQLQLMSKAHFDRDQELIRLRGELDAANAVQSEALAP
ncbi:MAG: hypothetical protein U0836_08270 [Pirellulales bacterium]